MASLLVLYRTATDPEAFMDHYRSVHLPMATRLPHLAALKAWQVEGTPQSESEYQLVSRLDFRTREEMMDAMRSPEGRAAGQDLVTFASEGFKMLYLGDDIAGGGA